MGSPPSLKVSVALVVTIYLPGTNACQCFLFVPGTFSLGVLIYDEWLGWPFPHLTGGGLFLFLTCIIGFSYAYQI
ncbi:MAG: hypothetical protein ACFFBD_03715 [Candidatus Hodarchaeota archaeon]